MTGDSAASRKSADTRPRCGAAFRAMLRVLTWLLFVAASLPMSGTASAQQLLEYPETVLSGDLSAELPNPLERCRRLCYERSGCAGFDHASATNTCRMFTSVTSARLSRGSFASTRQAVSGYHAPVNLPPPLLPQPSQSAWLHNGSVMVLHQKPKEDGSSEIEIVYDVPKNQLLKVGIRPGSTLFKGTLADGSLFGNARLTSSRCGIIQYEVQGVFDPLSLVPFFLRGAAPKRGRDCNIESWSTTGENANLRFDPQ